MRSSGILMPVFSLPGKYGIGCFSKKAYEFIDFLSEAGQSLWQILPLGPTSYGDSPYQSFSTFAGNPYFIDLEELIKIGLLQESEIKETGLDKKTGKIDYEFLYNTRFDLLRKAYERADIENNPEFQNFVNNESEWLEDYALYMAVKASFNNRSLEFWDKDIRIREPKALKKYSDKYRDDVLFFEFIQFEFDREWKKLKAYANSKGVSIIGDIPIYVSGDSADVWANPKLFQLDQELRPIRVAGCPPDAFAVKGQLWGNPLYDWEYHKETDYDWWKKRMEKCADLYDVIRIDHFRGFDQFYSIPGDAEDAVNGKWINGPGTKLFRALQPELDKKGTRIIAEDLGFITDTVRKLVKETGYPNMKVIEFAFDPDDDARTNDFLPFNYDKNCVAYTGTHDNETVMAWLKRIDKRTYQYIRKYVGGLFESKRDVARSIIKEVIASPAKYAIIPIQDYLLLGEEGRINIPSTLGGNWQWRLDENMLTPKLARKIRNLTSMYGRNYVSKEKASNKAKKHSL
ncbi:MAG: 4-alpha-glucanotransferase [Lachnospiraceae bacterium]|jgi:4-alpha-glucanotransferase|nr:4-alpha-glucanotransferase [Lachnospiraceae bacterium]